MCARRRTDCRDDIHGTGRRFPATLAGFEATRTELNATARVLIEHLQRLRDWRRLPAEVRARYGRDRNRRLNEDPGIPTSVAATVGWLCRAQDESSTSDGGVARHYSIIDGWGASYPETTGYIIPTLLDYAKSTGQSDVADAARRMLDWLVAIQLQDGAFQGGTITDRPVAPTTFNTGQILMGLSHGSTEFGEPYTTAMHRAASWLAECQDQDGCWRKNQSPFARAGDKTYETHTAWGLLEASRASGNASYGEAALRNIHWALGKQSPNGWFADCCLTDPVLPLTHTLGYALRGIIEGYLYSQDKKLLQAACLSADGLLETVRRDGFIPGRLDKNWRAAVDWSCLTGSVQIAHCWLQLFSETGKQQYLDAARLVNQYVRRTVDFDEQAGTHGAIRGSFPIYGEYGQNQYLNWAAKFFVDANLLEESIVSTR
jgi:hypothetical protein